MSDNEEVKVLIVNENGHYLAGTATHWEFTEDRARAKVFDYLEDQVPAILRLVQKSNGRVWIAVKLDPHESSEFCDRCGTRLPAYNMFFDGSQVVCPACRDEQSL